MNLTIHFFPYNISNYFAAHSYLELDGTSFQTRHNIYLGHHEFLIHSSSSTIRVLKRLTPTSGRVATQEPKIQAECLAVSHRRLDSSRNYRSDATHSNIYYKLTYYGQSRIRSKSAF